MNDKWRLRLSLTLAQLLSGVILLTSGEVLAQTIDFQASRPREQQISEYVRVVYQSKDGKYWFGTNDDGVACYDGQSLRYYTLADGLAGRAVRAVVEQKDGSVWIATDGGVSRFRDGNIESYTIKDGLSDDDVWSLMVDQEDRLWVGAKGGVGRSLGDKFVPFEFPDSKVGNPTFKFSPKLVWSMRVDQRGNKWFATDGVGARRNDGVTSTFFTTLDGLKSNQVSSIQVDDHGHVWLGFLDGGVCRYDGKKFRTFGKQDGLSEGWVWTMAVTGDGRLLVSVLGSGVHELIDDKFHLIETHRDGLPTHVQSLYEDRTGTLWMGCSGGLFRMLDGKLVNVTRVGPWPKK